MSASSVLGGLGGQVGDQVGGVVRRHLLQHVGGPLVVELAEDLDLVLLGELLEDVGEPLVVEGGGDLDRAAWPGRSWITWPGRPASSPPARPAGASAPWVWPPRRTRSTSRHSTTWVCPGGRTASALLQRDPADHPVAGALLVDGEVVDGALDAGVLDADLAVEHLADDQGLARALLEAAHVDHAGGDHLAAVDARHPGHGQEDRAPAEHLDDQAEDPRGRGRRGASPRPGRAPGRPGRPRGRRPAGRSAARRRRGWGRCSRAVRLASCAASDGRHAMLRYDVVDVFTDRAFAGNPLAVVTAPRGCPPSSCRRSRGSSLLRDDLPLAGAVRRGVTYRCGSSPRSASSRSPGTRRSARRGCCAPRAPSTATR